MTKLVKRWKRSRERSNARCMAANGCTARFTRRTCNGCGRRTRKIGKQRSRNLQRNTDSVSDSIVRDCAPSSINGRRRIANDVAPMSSTRLAHIYAIRPRKDHRGVDLIFITVDRALPSPAIE